MSVDLLERPLVRHSLHGPTMGSRWTATWEGVADFDLAALRAQLQQAVNRVDDQMSTWKPHSDLNRLNDAPVGIWVGLPQEIVTVLDAALHIGRATRGALNIGVGDLVRDWGFGFGSRATNEGAIAHRAPLLCDPPQTLRLDMVARRAMKLVPMRLDLSGIAKGFGVDQLADVMNAFGISSWLVGIDGELRAQGVRQDGRAWTVALERPQDEAREALGIIELADCAIATSGNYRHYRIRNGQRISHTMDARTGAPLDNDLASVTVLADRCMMADAWATAIIVAGAAEGQAVARKFGLPAILVSKDGQILSTL